MFLLIYLISAVLIEGVYRMVKDLIGDEFEGTSVRTLMTIIEVIPIFNTVVATMLMSAYINRFKN